MEQREVLLREMEEASALTARENLTRREERVNCAEELQLQVRLRDTTSVGCTSSRSQTSCTLQDSILLQGNLFDTVLSNLAFAGGGEEEKDRESEGGIRERAG